MKPNSQWRSVLAALSVSASCLAALWLWMVPDVVSQGTFAFMTVFMAGAAAVSLTTWRNAQATSTVEQLLYATEVAAVNATPASREATRRTSA